jgi:HK97 family phage major capsid protein
MTDLPIKDLQAMRQQYVDQREDVKKAAELEERDLTDTDVKEMEDLAQQIRNIDRQLKVKREDAKIAESAVLAGEASNGEARELRRMKRRFDLGTAVREAYQNGKVTGVAAEFTEEARKEARQGGVSLRGMLSIPNKVMRAAVDGTAGDFASGATGEGGQFVGTNIGTAIEALAAPTVFAQAGGRVLNGLTFNTDIPTVSTVSTISEVDEGAAPGADSGMDLGKASLTPQRFSAFATVTEQLMIQGGVAVENLIANDMRREMNRQIDKYAFKQLVPAGGDGDAAALTVGDLVTFEGQLVGAGVDYNNIVVIVNGAGHGTLADAALVSNVNAALDRTNNTLLGHRYFVTDVIPAGVGATGACIMGDLNMAAAMGFFGGLDIIVNPYTLDTSHKVRLSIHQYADAAVIYDAAYKDVYDDA